MKFLFTIYHEEETLDALSEREMQTLVDAALDYDEEIRRSGHYIVSNALQRAETARTLRVRGGKVSITDGPYAETKEQNREATAHASSMSLASMRKNPPSPPARLGVIEVRPVQELHHS